MQKDKAKDIEDRVQNEKIKEVLIKNKKKSGKHEIRDNIPERRKRKQRSRLE